MDNSTYPTGTLSATRYSELMETAQSLSSLDQIHAFCRRFSRELGFDHYIYGAVLPVSLVEPQTLIISGYPDAWWQHYQDHGYFGVDPVVAHTTGHQTLPLPWEQIDTSRDPKVAQFMREAADFGLGSGISFPVHGRHGECAVFSLVSSDSPERSRERVRDAMATGQLITGFIHEAAQRVNHYDSGAGLAPALTTRERDCLLWAAEGRTNSQIGDILGISARTVRFHFDNAADKLNVTSRTQAVARAVYLGHITPQLR